MTFLQDDWWPLEFTAVILRFRNIFAHGITQKKNQQNRARKVNNILSPKRISHDDKILAKSLLLGDKTKAFKIVLLLSHCRWMELHRCAQIAHSHQPSSVCQIYWICFWQRKWNALHSKKLNIIGSCKYIYQSGT